MTEKKPEALVLRGLDGANPLAFLAALGVLRVLTRADDDLQPRLAWQVLEGAWRPRLYTSRQVNESQLTEAIVEHLTYHGTSLSKIDESLPMGADKARKLLVEAQLHAFEGYVVDAEIFCALMSDIPASEQGQCSDTALKANRSHEFFKFARNIAKRTKVAHISRALFEPWDHSDPIESCSMRWDPYEDAQARYALRWDNPGDGNPLRKVRGTMWGANRLAIEGLPLLPVMPVARQLETTGFRTSGSRGTFWTWPIWETPTELDSVRSLLAMNDLQAETPDRNRLSVRGVVEVFRSQRLTVGKFRNFTWGVPA